MRVKSKQHMKFLVNELQFWVMWHILQIAKKKGLSTDKKRNDFYNYINKGGNSIYYNSRFAYIYNPVDKLTLGVSLQDLKYIGIDILTFVKEINLNNNNIIVDNLNFITQASFPLIKDNAKVLAYLNYLKNSDIYIETEK